MEEDEAGATSPSASARTIYLFNANWRNKTERSVHLKSLLVGEKGLVHKGRPPRAPPLRYIVVYCRWEGDARPGSAQNPSPRPSQGRAKLKRWAAAAAGKARQKAGEGSLAGQLSRRQRRTTDQSSACERGETAHPAATYCAREGKY